MPAGFNVEAGLWRRVLALQSFADSSSLLKEVLLLHSRAFPGRKATRDKDNATGVTTVNYRMS